MKYFKKKAMKLLVIFCSLVIIIIASLTYRTQFAWRTGGFDSCDNVGFVLVSDVEVADDGIKILGSAGKDSSNEITYTTSENIRIGEYKEDHSYTKVGFLGYYYERKGDSIYIGVKNTRFAKLFMNRSHEFSINIPEKGIKTVYLQGSLDSKKTLWESDAILPIKGSEAYGLTILNGDANDFNTQIVTIPYQTIIDYFNDMEFTINKPLNRDFLNTEVLMLNGIRTPIYIDKNCTFVQVAKTQGFYYLNPQKVQALKVLLSDFTKKVDLSGFISYNQILRSAYSRKSSFYSGHLFLNLPNQSKDYVELSAENSVDNAPQLEIISKVLEQKRVAGIRLSYYRRTAATGMEMVFEDGTYICWDTSMEAMTNLCKLK